MVNNSILHRNFQKPSSKTVEGVRGTLDPAKIFDSYIPTHTMYGVAIIKT